MTHTFKIRPQPKVRMVKSDAWKKRPCVLRYWGYKDQLIKQAKANEYILGSTLDIQFVFKPPKSWSKKKTAEMLGQPHQDTPDLDNLVKAFADCLTDQDKAIHTINASKIWGEEDIIIVK
jgi:Holliday junction resolvase RusA-like endonuclease